MKWMRRWWAAIGLAAAILAGISAFAKYGFTKTASNIPTARVQRTEFVDYVEIHGEVKARKSTIITAPYRAGDLQIIQLAGNGTRIKKGDVVVQFDTTELKQNLAQDQSALKSADAEIQQSRAQAHLKEEQDLTDVIKARYDVQSSELDASKQEILSKIDGEEAELKLADAEQKLKEVETKLASDKQSDAADIESKQQKRDQALYQVRQTERGLEELTLRAPTDGLVTLLVNWRASGPTGSAVPFKQGDRAWSGAAIAELPDLSTTEISGRIDETQRSRVRVGQTASVRIDAIPDREFTARVSEISEIASMDFSAGWPFPRNFTMDFSLDNADPRLRPNMSASVRIAVDRVADGIVIPAEAVYQTAGQSVAYVAHGSKFEKRVVEIERRSGDRVLIAKGLQAGERVALVDPTAAR